MRASCSPRSGCFAQRASRTPSASPRRRRGLEEFLRARSSMAHWADISRETGKRRARRRRLACARAGVARGIAPIALARGYREPDFYDDTGGRPIRPAPPVTTRHDIMGCMCSTRRKSISISMTAARSSMRRTGGRLKLDRRRDAGKITVQALRRFCRGAREIFHEAGGEVAR